MAKNIQVLVDGETGPSVQVPGGADWKINVTFLDVDGARLPLTDATIDFYSDGDRTGAIAFSKALSLLASDGDTELVTPDSDSDFVIGQRYYGFCRCTEAGGDLSVCPTDFILTVY